MAQRRRSPNERTIDVHIRRLRSKLGRWPTPCEPCAARATASTSTQKWSSGLLRNTRSSSADSSGGKPGSVCPPLLS
ncbi:hypothetical protein [Glutamicibacter nicotianae]|uniref:hypothetical protein n=1 Tax=Glutamicibacter nicotianae TaxID=37929 RepID=UPI0037C03213